MNMRTFLLICPLSSSQEDSKTVYSEWPWSLERWMRFAKCMSRIHFRLRALYWINNVLLYSSWRSHIQTQRHMVLEVAALLCFDCVTLVITLCTSIVVTPKTCPAKMLQIHVLLCSVFGKSCCHWDVYPNRSKVCRQSHASFIPQFIKTSHECIMAHTENVHPALLFHNRFDGRQTIVKVLQTGAMFCNICKLIRHSFNVLHLIGCLMSMYILKGKSVKGDKDDNWVHSEAAAIISS